MAQVQSKPDVEGIMRDIRLSLSAQLSDVSIPDFQDIPLPEDDFLEQLDRDLSCLPAEMEIPYYGDFGPGVSSYLKRFIHKAIRCVVYPIVFLQNAFNTRSTAVMVRTRDILEPMILQAQMQQIELDNLRLKISSLEQQVQDLQGQLTSPHSTPMTRGTTEAIHLE